MHVLAKSGVLCSVLLASAPAFALTCPNPHDVTSQSALKETEQDIQSDSQLIAARGGTVVADIVGRLKRRFPKSRDAEITNYLVALYCPVVSQRADLSEAEKRSQMRAFSTQVDRELSK